MLTQRRQVDWHYVKAVIKIFTEAIGLDFRKKITIGRSDDPGVDFLGIVVTNPLELPFLQYAKKFDLQLGRGAVDLVKEDTASVCCFKATGAIIYRARKRAFDMAKKFTFEQAFCQGATIDTNVWASGAWAKVMNGARNKFFAGAGLAYD